MATLPDAHRTAASTVGVLAVLVAVVLLAAPAAAHAESVEQGRTTASVGEDGDAPPVDRETPRTQGDGEAGVIEDEEGVEGDGLDVEESRDVDLSGPVLVIAVLALLGLAVAGVLAARRRAGQPTDAQGAGRGGPEGGRS